MEFLGRQLRGAGRPVNENIANMFIQSLASKPLADRIRRWKIRKNQLNKIADSPCATSGGPAVWMLWRFNAVEKPEKAAIE